MIHTLNMPNSEARERVLVAAENLFTERGYRAVTVKDIAKAAGIHHASIYHHLPEGGGKEGLYIEVTERSLKRHAKGIGDAIASGEDLRSQLHAIADWLLSHPPLDMVRMVNADMPMIDRASAEQLLNLAFEVVLVPITELLEQAQQRGEIGQVDIGNVGGAIFSIIEGMHALPTEYVTISREAMAQDMIDVMLRGIRPSES